MKRHHDNISDSMLLEAVKKKALRDLEERAAAASVINNYGGGHEAHGIMGAMGGHGSEAPDDRDYFVDIDREDRDGGWTKKVHRYTKPHGEGSPFPTDKPYKKKRS